jgi:hypothetical protein
MKKWFIALYLLLASLSVHANKIDKLKTDSDVVHFLISLNKKFVTGKNTPKLTIEPIDSVFKNNNCFICDTLCKTWGAESWQKIDLNKDGRTDLTVICHWYNYNNYIVMDNGDNTFKLISLQYNSGFCELINVIHRHNQNLIVFHGISTDMYYTFQEPRTDTLIYKYGYFIELNKHPAKYDIDSVILTDGYIKNNNCGSCPKFEMTITQTDSLSFDKYKYSGTTVKTDSGYRVDDFKFKVEPFLRSQLSEKQRTDIFDLIKYISFKKFKDHYQVPWTDDWTSTIRIRFKDGTSKTITDYGLRGTFGLHALFAKLYAIVKTNKII